VTRAAGARVVLRLYVAGAGPNSVAAAANLRRVCEEHLRGRYRLEIVDVLREPSRAVRDGVVLSPTLVKVSLPPRRRIVGTLRDHRLVLEALGLEEARADAGT
jgi:circadian clock protein KaiB